jgi:hypothetical protein
VRPTDPKDGNHDTEIESMKVEANSFIRFVYPFLFDAGDFGLRVAHVDAFQLADLGPLWEKKRFPERELLPHVARFLNPGERDVPTVRLWQVAPKVLQSPGGLGGGAKNPGADWCFVRGSGQGAKQTRFAIEDCQLTLFHGGVGFLSVRVRPEVDDVPNWPSRVASRPASRRGVLRRWSRACCVRRGVCGVRSAPNVLFLPDVARASGRRVPAAVPVGPAAAVRFD